MNDRQKSLEICNKDFEALFDFKLLQLSRKKLQVEAQWRKMWYIVNIIGSLCSVNIENQYNSGVNLKIYI